MNDTIPTSQKGLDKQRDKHFKNTKKNVSFEIFKSVCSSWLVSRAIQLVNMNMLDEAERDCIEARTLAPEEVMPYIQLSVVAYYKGEYPKSIAILQNAPKTTTDALGNQEDNRFDILFYMGLSYIKMGDEDKGVSCFRLALKFDTPVTQLDEIRAEISNTPADSRQENRELMQEMIALYEEDHP